MYKFDLMIGRGFLLAGYLFGAVSLDNQRSEAQACS